MSHHVCQAQNRHKCPIYKDLSHFFALNTFDAGIYLVISVMVVRREQPWI